MRVRVGLEHADPEVQAIHAEYVAALVPQVLGWVSESEIDPVEAAFTHEARGALLEAMVAAPENAMNFPSPIPNVASSPLAE